MRKDGKIVIENLDKHFGDQHVVNNISLTIQPGEFISLLGPSGCGKTTLLRLIAGFEQLDGGSIYLDDIKINHLPPHKRKLHTIFQNYALFPHMNVFDNIAYGLKATKMSKSEIKDAVDKSLRLVQLEGYEKRMPCQMSGGQRQRISIARAIVNKPPVLLLDEPLTALDMKLRKEMRLELRNIQQQLGITFIYVTHDQEEAVVMSDRIVVLNSGNVQQIGTPEEIYNRPNSIFVSDFIGDTNAFDAVIKNISSNVLELETEEGSFLAMGEGFKCGELISVSIRPNLILWSEELIEAFDLVGVVKEHIFQGNFIQAVIELKNNKEIFVSRLAGSGLPKVGQKVYLYWNLNDAVVMHTEGECIKSVFENINLGEWLQL